MNYLRFRTLMAGFTVFSLADIRQADPAFHRRRLNEWQDKGYIRQVTKGYYTFSDSDMPIEEHALFEISNRIYAPSYVSFEMALAYHGLIPESVYGITCASTRKTMTFTTTLGTFMYHTVRPKLYFGFEHRENNGRTYKIADAEKAILDYLYLKPGLKDADTFASLRLNRKTFLSAIDRRKLTAYAAAYTRKGLAARALSLWEYIKHA